MDWGIQQQAALAAVSEWLRDRKGQQVFRLFGYAGTGKTTLAKHIASNLDGKVLYAAFTGKAALVLRKKGCEGALTIHSLIYRAEDDEDTGEITYELNWGSPLKKAALLIVDEVSMVNEELGSDLLKFKVPILVLGDPHQLPPVTGTGFFDSATPDVMLTDIHRQALENPIIRLSMDVRTGNKLAVGYYGDSRIANTKDIDTIELHEMLLNNDQLLVGRNITRTTYNDYIRESICFDPAHPEIGDRLICLKNNHKRQLLNGELWEVNSVKLMPRYYEMIIASIDDPSRPNMQVKVLREFFKGTEANLDWRERKKYDEFTYGWALTVHKSQGSEWNHVLLMDESRVFRDVASRHLYTGITRAADSITILI